MTNPRQLAPTVGLSHDGFEFLKGRFEGLEGYAIGRMTKSRGGKLYIDDVGWGPEPAQLNMDTGFLRRNPCLHQQDRRAGS